MRKLFVIALIVLAFGCKRKKSLQARLDEFGQITATTCACPDEACARYQQKVYDAWQFRNDSTDSAKMTEAQRSFYHATYKQFQDCVTAKLSQAPTGSAATAPPSPPTP
jgi:hypothetical protein